MKYTELKEGEIYYCNWQNGDSFIYLFRATTDCKICNNLELKSKGYFHKNGGFDVNTNIYREATQQEKEHFLQCEKAGKYVEHKPENIEILIFN